MVYIYRLMNGWISCQVNIPGSYGSYGKVEDLYKQRFISRPLQIWFRESEEVPRLGAVNIDTRHPYMVHLTDRSQRAGFDKKKVCDFSCVFLDGVMINHVESGVRYQQKIMTDFMCVFDVYETNRAS